jgi:tRNA (guanine6-N2)-methyltransferase
MPRNRGQREALPPCYAMTLPGLESVAEEEIVETLGGEVKRTAPGLVVFRLPQIDERLLQLRTTEDVFLLAWGTDKLTRRAADLERVRHWTAHDVDWNQLLRIHHAVRPKPRSKPTYHLVVQMSGEHGYRRTDARAALAEGLSGKLPASWRPAEENAAVEVWLTIDGNTAFSGLRLSDRTMRHRRYKLEHLPASLRPTIAAAMVRLAELRPGMVVLDPMCGAGTILAEVLEEIRRKPRNPVFPKKPGFCVWGGDIERSAVRAAAGNLRRLGSAVLARWDARDLPLPDASMDRLICNPPFGKQLSRPELVGPLYRCLLREWDRVLHPYGRAVLLVSDIDALNEAAAMVGWKRLRALRIRVLGQPAGISVWKKGNLSRDVAVPPGES